MNKILIDTMHIYALLTREGDSDYRTLAKVCDDKTKIIGVVSVVTLTELINLLGKNIYKKKLNELLSSNLVFVDTDRTIAARAGELHMNQKLPTGDALIAATGIVENIKHVLTDDANNGHFDAVKNLIKPIDLKTALKMAR